MITIVWVAARRNGELVEAGTVRLYFFSFQQLRDTQQMDEELYGRNMAPLTVEIEGPMSEVSIIHYACNIYSYTPVNHESFDGDKEILAGKHFIQPLTAHRYEDEVSSG